MAHPLDPDEVTQNSATRTDRPPSENTGWRRWVTILLIVVTSVAGFAAVFGVWANNTLFDTDRFMRAVGPTLEDPAFYRTLAIYTGNEIVEGLSLEERLAVRLGEIDELLATLIHEVIPFDVPDRWLELIDRPTLAALAPAIADPIEERIRQAATVVITSDAVSGNISDAVATAHRGVVALALNDVEDMPNVYVADGEVYYNLLPVIAEALNSIAEDIAAWLPDVTLPTFVADRVEEAIAQFRAELGESVPDDFGQVRLMSEASLNTLQTGANQLRTLIWVWVFVTIGLAVATVAFSRNRRRTGIQLALGFAAALLVGALVLAYFQNLMLEALTTANGELVGGFLKDLFSQIRTFTIIVAIVAIVAAVLLRRSGATAPDGAVAGVSEQ